MWFGVSLIPLSTGGGSVSEIFYQQVLRGLCLLCMGTFVIASDPAGVKRINKELAQITLAPAAFSASSVYNNQPEFQAHKAK
ncbi:Discoidin domain-containing receptor 2 [Fasciola gigantica]|uniref:Discoidin domain-containing receptor 2 n=1 Tax=Fasciola gigantica TaxID=46835 RepID=A0A504YVG9_FASGI|nr:Discoidin domain-containing receptor 2 [Fasciola gigantica]